MLAARRVRLAHPRRVSLGTRLHAGIPLMPRASRLFEFHAEEATDAASGAAGDCACDLAGRGDAAKADVAG